MAVEISEFAAAPLAATATVDKRIEEDIHKLCAEVLSRPLAKVKLGRSFLAHGGDSLLAIKLMARCQSIGYTINVQDLLQATSIREFCRYVKPQDRGDGPALHLLNGINGSNGTTLSNGHAGPTGTARAPLDDPDAGGHLTPADLPSSVGQPQKQGEGKRSRHTDDEVPPFSLWQEAERALEDDGSLFPSTMDERLRLVAEQCGVSVDMVEDVYPCTPLQESLMAVTAEQPRAYVNRWVYRMPQDLDTARFKESWVIVARAAPLMRTRVVLGPLGTALQVVVREDLRWSSGADLSQCLSKDDESLMGYGMPLVRLAIAGNPDSDNGQYVVFTAHHSTYDGWSWTKLFNLAVRTYQQRDDSISASPPFTRFIQYLGRCGEAEARSFWQSQLYGHSAVPFPARPTPSYNPNPSQIIIHQVVTPEVAGITIAGLLRAAWALVISSHTGDDDVVFASVLSGRTAPVKDVSEMLAPTITTVPIRIRVDKAQPVAEYLAAIQKQAISMMPFEHTGLQNIYRHVGARLDMGHLFTVQPAHVWTSVTTAPPLGLEVHTAPDTRADGYGLSVECLTGGSADPSSVQIRARFDDMMVSAAFLGRLLARFSHILTGLARVLQDDGLIGDVDIVSPEDVAKVAQWNGRIPEPRQALVHELVREAGLLCPEAEAVCSWDGSFSHGELDSLAERLAGHLITLGVGPEVAVAVCFDKSKWVVVAMLAILKAGGVVVSIAAEPVQRAQAVLHDTGARVLLTTQQYASRFPEAAHALVVDDDLFASLPTPPGLVESRTSPSNAAFIIYTSGSTGRPKGVVLEHVGLSTSMRAHGEKFGMDRKTRVFQFGSLTFDIVIHDVFSTLQFGGCVCMPSEEERMGDLAGAMKRMLVNFTFFTPRVLPTLQPSDVPGLQTLLVGGEALQPEHIKPWLDRMLVHQVYGPTECSIFSTSTKLDNIGQAANIGSGLAGLGLWVVHDADPNRLLPIGTVGELLIEGPFLARGYLNDAEKSLAAFITNPSWLSQYGFDTGPGGIRRFYRTGDLVRQNDDGSLTFVGRRDSQVKLRGQRIELGEVEHHLKLHSLVGDAVVFAPRQGPAKSSLVALLTFNELMNTVPVAQDLQPTTPDQTQVATSLASSVRKQLIDHLPLYMIPDTWISLRSLPQNVNNKTDRSRLLQWLQGMDAGELERIVLVQEEDAPAAPANRLQEQLQAVLAKVLRLPADKVLMNRSFLSLGGDSISAMQVISQCRNQHGITLTARDVLQSTTVAQIATRAAVDANLGHVEKPSLHTPLIELLTQLTASPSSLETGKGDLSSPDLAHEGLSQLWDSMLQVGITGLEDVEDVYYCSPTQQGIILSQIRDPTTYNIRQICEFQSPGTSSGFDLGRLLQSWHAVVNRHAILRTIFVQATAGQEHLFYQVVLKQYKPQVRVINEKGPDDALSALSQAGPATYAAGQPNHCLTFCATESGAVYAKLEISHALVDGASLDLALRDLVNAYEGILPESAAPSFGTYVQFLRQKPEAESLAYWARQLADAQPCYLPPSATQLTQPTLIDETGSVNIVTTHIGDARILHGFRDTHRVTIANMVQLAWAIVLARYTGSTDSIFGYATNGRDAPVPGANEIVGPMVNMTVSRIRLGDLPKTVAHAAQQVQDGFLEAFENQRTSLGSIQHALKLPEGGLFNTVVTYFRRSPEHAPVPGGLKMRNVATEGSTEYDANLNILIGDDTLDISLHYSTSFMDEESARLVLENTRHTLLSIAESTKDELDELETLSPSDVEKLLRWNLDIPPASDQNSLQQRIHQQCLARLDAQAVCAWDGELSYAELDAFSDRLAGHLDTLGVREGTMVGLFFEKSMWTIVAMLAVVKAGGVMVPLGIQLPPQRLSFLLDNTKALAVLTSVKCAAKVEHVETPHKCIVNAAFFEKLPEAARLPVRPSPAPEDPAIVMYTSGSTGLPKGAVVTHGGLCASLDAHGAAVGLDTSTRALQYSAYSFDFSLFDIFGALWFGGCVCVASEEDRMNPNHLARAVREMGVNFMLSTPTVASILDPTTVPSLHTLALGGEALQPAVVEMWSDHASIFNCYGPTECSIMCIISGPLTDKNLANNIGYPPAAAVWVAEQDDYNRLVPIGAVGELLVEGPLLAQGYLHDPERTAAVFINDPDFVSRYGLAKPHQSTQRRMYRTGDLVRQSPADGSLTYIGRRDGQVKIRGQRLEVGEIEYWTKQAFDQARTVAADLITPAVRNGVPVLAVALEIPCQDTPDNSSPLLPLTDALHGSLSALQDGLVRALPSFMVPGLYVPVQRMPLTTSGKLDRGQLKKLLNGLEEHQLSQYALVHECTSPGRPLTDSESRLRDLWVSVLSANAAVGPASDFFRLGGDSVAAMRLIAKAAKAEPPIRLRVADVFGNPVLENMARIVAGKPANSTGHLDTSNAGEMDAAPFSLMPTPSAAQDTLVRLAAQCGVAPDAIEDAYPCTPLQEGLLAITAREQSAYIGCWVFRMGDGLDADLFRSAWEKVSEMAVIMRTRIVAGDDGQVSTQVVVREPLPWSTVSSDLDTYLSQDEPNPMGVGRSLMRFTVVSTPRSGRFFVWKAHHSTYDGWTSHKLLQAVRDVYSGQAPTAFVPYTRFIKYLRRENAQSETEEYWRSQLKGDLDSSFPVVPPNHRPQSSSAISLRIAPVVTSSTFTTATLLRAAWALVLSQETGSRDVVFAATLSGRMAPVPGILDMAAPTLATAPVRISTSRNCSVGDYLAAVQRQAADMIPFEHAGLQNIKQMLPGKMLDLNHLFVVQPFADRVGHDGASLLPQGLEPVPYSTVATFHGYPLVVECSTGSEAQDGDHDIELEARFDEAVLPSNKAGALMERFKHVFVQLRAAASSDKTNSPLAHIDMLGPQDLSRIREWNQWSRAADPISDKCIHDLVHLQSLAQPDAQAVCAWDGQLTYAELDGLSLKLAHHLVGLGVCPEAPVLMIFEKSLWGVVAYLAILRAGGTVVPVGHKHPVQRVQGIIQATGARVILSSKEYELHRGLVPHVLAVNEQLMSRLPSGQQGPPCEGIKATNAAFIIFTSGSTGIPKGVILEHHTLVRSMKVQADLFAGPMVPRVLLFASYTFDGSIGETFVPLTSGGCVCVPSEEDRLSNLAAVMETMRVNLACLTPTVAGFLQPEALPSLKSLVFVGEPLKREIIAKWAGSGVQTWNGYGPSECSIISTCHRLSDASEATNIGTAVAGSNLWVVDPFDHHCLVPVGIPGELLVEGPLVGRGYLGDDEKTAAAFVTDPAWLGYFDFGPRQGRRFYRTGDLVRQAPNGSLMCLGRRDTQVKLHGQRLEIGEIEHWVKKVLGAQAGAAMAGLLARETEDGSAGEPVLAVAVEMGHHAESGTEPEQEQKGEGPFSLLPLSDSQRELFARLQASLSDVLPFYMVPHLYIPVNKLPTLDSGKLDRRVVWATIQQSHRSSQYSVVTNRTKVAPSSDTGRQLQQLWAAALRIPPQEIGADDDFFLSGGDSISAMRLVAKARETTRMPLAVADIFQHPVLENLAKILDARQSGNALAQSNYRAFSTIGVADAGPYVAEFIQPLLLDGGYAVDAAPVTDSQGLSVVMSLRDSRDYTLNIKLAGEGPCEVEKWRASCWELLRRHEILRTAYVFVKEQLFQVVLQTWHPTIAHFETDDDTIDSFTSDLLERGMSRPLRLGRPFIEFAIVTSPSQHRIIFRICHAEYDPISMTRYLEDLGAIHAGKANAVAPSSFIRDYISTLVGNPEKLRRSRSYWRGFLRGASMPSIASPQVLRPSKLIQHATRNISLPGPSSQSGQRTTAAALMRAAWGLTLSRFTGLADVTFGDVVSGRSAGEPKAIGATGCCVNIVAARIVIHADTLVRELLDAAQAQHVARLPHETVGSRELLGNCGKMAPEDPHFTTRINHIDHRPQWDLTVGDGIYQTSWDLPKGVHDVTDLYFTSYSYSDHIEIDFRHREGAISAEAADQILSYLCAASELLASPSSEAMRLGELVLGPHGDSWPVVGYGSVALGIGQPEEEAGCGV